MKQQLNNKEAKPAKTTLFAGGKGPALRRNFLRLINK
jgi:hypothetical protein